ncbi:MAG: thioredoxin family protein [Myxococcota bacterium]
MRIVSDYATCIHESKSTHLWALVILGLLLLPVGCSGKKDGEAPAIPSYGGTGTAKAAPGTQGVQPSKISLGVLLPGGDVKMVGTDDEEHSLDSAATEKGLLVIFTCNHCPWVKAWEARTVALGNSAQKKGIGVIAVNPNDPKAYPEDGIEEMKERAQRAGMEYPYVVDATSEVGRAFGADKTPEIFLFDGERKLVYRGTIDDNAQAPQAVKKKYLKDAIEAVSKGAAVPVSETKALGCSIKYRPEA